MSGVRIRDKEYGVGQHIHHGSISDIRVDEYHEAIVYEKPNVGGGDQTALMQAGHYNYSQLRYRWMNRANPPHLIDVRPTEIEKGSLLRLVWWQNDRHGKRQEQSQFLPPGEWDCKNEFPNDRIEHIDVPDSGSVTIYDGIGLSDRNITLGPGPHDLKDYDLYKVVSSLVFKLDDYEEISVTFGEPTNKHKSGQTRVSHVDLEVPAGRSSVNVSIGTSRIVSVDKHWEASASITSNTTIKAKSLGVELEQSLSISASAGGGESKGKSDQDSFTVAVDVQPDENNRVKGSMAVDLYEATIPAVRILKNLRTDKELKQKGEYYATILDTKGSFV